MNHLILHWLMNDELIWKLFFVGRQVRDEAAIGISTTSQHRIVEFGSSFARRSTEVDRIVRRLDGVQM